MVQAIGIESMVTRARLRYTRDYLTLGICDLIKPAVMNLSTDLAYRQCHYVEKSTQAEKGTL